MSRPKLNFTGADWIATKSHLSKKLADIRKSHEENGTSIEQTQFLRGKIALLKEIIDWDNPLFTQFDK